MTLQVHTLACTRGERQPFHYISFELNRCDALLVVGSIRASPDEFCSSLI